MHVLSLSHCGAWCPLDRGNRPSNVPVPFRPICCVPRGVPRPSRSVYAGEPGEPFEPGEVRWSRRSAIRPAIDFSLGSFCHGAITLSGSVPICAQG